MIYTYIEESDALEQYRDFIDDCNNVKIFGMSFCASRVLEELDPIAFNCGFSDWLDSMKLTTDLISFRVELIKADTPMDEDSFQASTYFKCEAEDEEHAKEQAENAYTDCEVLEVKEV